MSFQLLPNETAARGLLRVFRGELEHARARMANDGRFTDKDVHEARKAIKRARATLRMLRTALPAEDFRKTNLSLRDIARPLTHIRDARVLEQALEELREHFGSAADCMSTDTLEHALHSQRIRARRDFSAASSLESLRAGLTGVEADARRWRPHADRWGLLGPSVRRLYRRARRAYAAACEARSEERLHEWRKQTKHLWYALRVLTPLRPGRIGELADQAHKLTEYLGDDHDLAMLRKHLDAGFGLTDDDEEMLEALIDRRRIDLQDRAFAVGERLLQRKPRRFVQRLKRDWRAWDRDQPSAAKTAVPSPKVARSAKRVAEGAARLH